MIRRMLTTHTDISSSVEVKGPGADWFPIMMTQGMTSGGSPLVTILWEQEKND